VKSVEWNISRITKHAGAEHRADADHHAHTYGMEAEHDRMAPIRLTQPDGKICLFKPRQKIHELYLALSRSKAGPVSQRQLGASRAFGGQLRVITCVGATVCDHDLVEGSIAIEDGVFNHSEDMQGNSAEDNQSRNAVGCARNSLCARPSSERAGQCQ